MTEHDINAQSDHQQRKHAHRRRRSRLLKVVLAGFMLVFVLGNGSSCEESRLRTVGCQDLKIVAEPGTCVQFQNPCEPSQWASLPKLDGFQLRDEPPGISVLTDHGAAQAHRSICVADSAPLIFDQPFVFVYRSGLDYGYGKLILTVAPRLTLDVTALPSVLASGDSALLNALASGGVPPYSYLWDSDVDLNHTDIQQPIATPRATTTYTVRVTDASGQEAVGFVTVSINLGVGVTAAPGVINAGGTSQLDVITTGGKPPYSYLWDPAKTLDDPSRRNPVASPATTTTYTVVVTDEAGQTAPGSVTVNVAAPAPSLTANFSYNVLCCPTLNLNAEASAGNIVSYSWDLSWTAAEPDRVTSSPATSFTIRETDRGNIRLTVTDAGGNTATVTKNFP